MQIGALAIGADTCSKSTNAKRSEGGGVALTRVAYGLLAVRPRLLAHQLLFWRQLLVCRLLPGLSNPQSPLDKVFAMQWYKRVARSAVIVSLALPVMAGCEQRQQVRPEVIEPETPEGRMQIRDGETSEDVNIGVRQDEE